MKTLIFICGIYSIFWAAFHSSFWRIFKWNHDLKKLTIINEGIMQIFNIQTIYYLLFVAFACFFYSNELLTTKFGNVFLISCSLFWVIRAIQQFVFLRVTSLFSIILTILFICGAIMFAVPVIL